MNPLDGIRVIDFGHVWAGPFSAQALGDLGAEVIRVESHGHVDVHRRAGPYGGGRRDLDASAVWNAQNRGKLSCSLNLKEPRAIELALELVSRSQIIVENFTPGTLERLGLGFTRLRARNPAVILISLSGYGQDGPWRRFPAYGPMMDAVGGLAHAVRGIDGVPQSMNGWFPDTSAALYGALAALAAIHDARSTGEGAHIDISELETTTTLLPELMALAGSEWPSIAEADVHSNADGGADLICVLPVTGEDKWISLRLASAAEWDVTCEELKITRPMPNPAEPGSSERAVALLAPSARGRDGDELASALQARGIEAVPVLSARDLLEDGHLVARGAFMTAEHPRAGTFRSYAPVIGRDIGPAPVRDRAPMLGEHNAYVFEELLGLTTDERQALEESRVIW